MPPTKEAAPFAVATAAPTATLAVAFTVRARDETIESSELFFDFVVLAAVAFVDAAGAAALFAAELAFAAPALTDDFAAEAVLEAAAVAVGVTRFGAALPNAGLASLERSATALPAPALAACCAFACTVFPAVAGFFAFVVAIAFPSLAGGIAVNSLNDFASQRFRKPFARS
ncbi:hypothetical protein [Mesorhizobium sp. BE184]|uniref:hypothetical protein n=1 Tax=Mesorhizobium sp. BE184 TaxID=2817714 RepID=UPI00285F43E1|nr:hypothetical protein [Mesorhizobium sp. BE184]MDR7033464.1 hypothetical protein [Mesorhizobium sp. BE184]